MLEDFLSKLETIISYIQKGVAVSRHILEILQLIYADLVAKRAKHGLQVESA